jgi:YaiO family outer membrane protein
MKKLLATLLAALALVLPDAVRADTTFEFQDNDSGFTSPGNALGPWDTRTLAIRHDGTRDSPGLTLINRIDFDQAAPQHSNGLVLDDYHNWTPRFFSYVSLSAAAGQILPNRGAYLEGNYKFGPLVVGAGASTSVNTNQTVLNQLSFGPTYYWPKFNVTFRYEPGWLNPGGYIGTYLLSAGYGVDQRATTTLTLQAGAQPPFNNPLLAGTDQRSYAGTLLYKRWIGHFGIEAGANYAYVTRPSDGSLIYIQRGVIVGTFATLK